MREKKTTPRFEKPVGTIPNKTDWDWKNTYIKDLDKKIYSVKKMDII